MLYIFSHIFFNIKIYFAWTDKDEITLGCAIQYCPCDIFQLKANWSAESYNCSHLFLAKLFNDSLLSPSLWDDQGPLHYDSKELIRPILFFKIKSTPQQ